MTYEEIENYIMEFRNHFKLQDREIVITIYGKENMERFNSAMKKEFDKYLIDNEMRQEVYTDLENEAKLKKEMENHNMHDWVFHKNTYSGKWEAVKREHYADLFNNHKSKHILRSSSIKTLEEIINKTDGDENKINEMLKQYK